MPANKIIQIKTVQFKRQERLCRLQSFQTQIDTLHFQGHTSDSMVRMSLVIDRIIDLHKENSNWGSKLKMQVICNSEFKCVLKILTFQGYRPTHQVFLWND